MTVWQSLALISPWQAAYALGLAVLFYTRGPSLIAWVLLADFIAILAVMGAMDFGLLVRAPGNDQATGAVLVVWCITAAVLVSQPGLARVLAGFSFVGISIFAATLYFGVQTGTTSAIVNALALVQLAVAGIGLGGDDGGNRGRYSDRGNPVSVSGGDYGMVGSSAAQGAGGLARRADLLSQDGGGRG